MAQPSLAPPITDRHLTITQKLALRDNCLLTPRAVEPAFAIKDTDLQRMIDDRGKQSSPKTRNATMVRAMFTTNCRNLPIPGGVVLAQGINEVVIPRDCYDQVVATMCADEMETSRLAEARALYIRQAAILIKAKLPEYRWSEVSLGTIEKMIEVGDQDAEFVDASRKTAARDPISIEGMYERLYPPGGVRPDGSVDRPMPPISRAEILEDLGVPETSAMAAQDRIGKTIAQSQESLLRALAPAVNKKGG